MVRNYDDASLKYGDISKKHKAWLQSAHRQERPIRTHVRLM